MPAVATPGVTDARLRRGERFVRADYRRVFAEGISIPSRSFVGWVLTSSPAAPEPPRLGVVVSRRTFPLAVQRSRARRLMREAFRLSKAAIAPGAWVLLVGRRHLSDPDATSRDVAREFRRFCRRAGVAAPQEAPR